MHHKYTLRFYFKSRNPAHQSLIIRMAADARQPADFCLHLNLLAEQLYIRCPLQKRPARRPVCLISDEQNGRFFPPEVMLQVVLDPARITHAARRQNHLRLRIFIDRPGIICRDRSLQPRKADRIDASPDQLQCLLIKVTPHVLAENIGCLDRQRTVHPDLKSIVVFHQTLFFDPPDKIQHFLCPSNCKRRYNHISAAVKRPLDHLRKLHRIIHRRIMAPVTVCRFHDHIIRAVQILRIADQRLVCISDITGKDKLLLRRFLPDPDFD